MILLFLLGVWFAGSISFGLLWVLAARLLRDGTRPAHAREAQRTSAEPSGGFRIDSPLAPFAETDLDPAV